MMKYFLLSFMLALFACHSTSETVQNADENAGLTDSLAILPPMPQGRTIIQETGADCSHSVAEPVVKKGSFPNTTFELQSDKRSGIETIYQDNGDKVVIKNWGCEYIALTVHFETGRFQGEVSNVGFWYKRTVTLLNELNKNLNAPIDIVKGTERLVTEIENNVSNGYENLTYNRELDFGEDATRNFVSIDSVQSMQDGKFEIVVTFARGPL